MSHEMCQACGHVGDDVSLVDVEEQPMDGFRQALMCPRCIEAVDADLWISKRCWESINPRTPFDQLPKMKDED